VTVPASGAARRSWDRAVALLDRLVPAVRAVYGAVVVFTALVGVSGLVMALALLAVDPPGTWWTWLSWFGLAALLAAPAAVLAVFSRMLREVLGLPAKLRALPEVGPAHAAELARLAGEAASRPPGTRLRSLPADTWRAARLVVRAHDDVPYVGVLLSIVRLPFLVLVAVATVAGLGQLVFAPLTVAAALAGRVL